MPATKHLISIVGAGLLAVGVVTGANAQAAPGTEPPPKGPLDDIQESVVNALEKGLNLLSIAIGTVLPYKLPEVLPNGDIIIRYVPPKPPEPAPAPEAPVEGQTKT